jgi:hypothetical protein
MGATRMVGNDRALNARPHARFFFNFQFSIFNSAPTAAIHFLQ